MITALNTCVESQSIEFKESAPWTALQHKIAKAAMAMANLRDGGVVIIGVSERADVWERTGISDEHLATYDVDTVIDGVNRYASPPFNVLLVLVNHEDRRFLAIEVPEFTDTPIVCRREAVSEGLKPGAVYVRPPGKTQTTVVTSAEQMHDLLELAAEKRARRILELMERLKVAPMPKDPFDEELRGL